MHESVSDVQSDTSFEISDIFTLITHPALDSSKFEAADCEFEILNDDGNGKFQIGIPKNVTRKQFELALNLEIPNQFSIVDLYADTTKCYKINASEVFDKQEKDYIYFAENKYKSYDKVFVNKRHVYKDNNNYYIKFDALNMAFKNKRKNMLDYINSNCIHYAEIESYKFNK